MDEKMVYIETSKRKYPISFNLNAMEEIQEAYGSISAWGEIVENTDGGEPKIKDLKFGLMAMINEGIDIENEDREVKEPFLTSRQVGRIITEVGFAKITEKIKEVSVNSTKNDENLKNV